MAPTSSQWRIYRSVCGQRQRHQQYRGIRCCAEDYLMQPLPFTTGFYVSDSLPLSAQECTNWYPVKMSAAARSQEILRGVPGSRQVATSGDSNLNIRGAHVCEGVPYFVN